MGDLGDGLTDLRQSGPHTVVDNLIFFVQDFLHVCPYAAGIESKSVVFFSSREICPSNDGTNSERFRPVFPGDQGKHNCAQLNYFHRSEISRIIRIIFFFLPNFKKDGSIN